LEVLVSNHGHRPRIQLQVSGNNVLC
jgi:hypothetical protein